MARWSFSTRTEDGDELSRMRAADVGPTAFAFAEDCSRTRAADVGPTAFAFADDCVCGGNGEGRGKRSRRTDGRTVGLAGPHLHCCRLYFVVAVKARARGKGR
jgi:hypothetical protein